MKVNSPRSLKQRVRNLSLSQVGNSAKIISGNLRSSGDHRTSNNNCEDFVSRSVSRENRLGRLTRRTDKGAKEGS